MKKIFNKDILTKILMIFLVVQPLLDIYILFSKSVVDFFGFSPSTIIRMIYIIFLVFSVLFFVIKIKKIQIWYLVYGAIVVVYAILHHMNALDFNSVVPGGFGYGLVSELFYIIRMLLPFCMMAITYYLPLNDKKLEMVIKWLVIFISGSIVVTNILGVSLGSYSKKVITGSIFTWFTNSDLNYFTLASKGFFNDPNRISALLVLITPLLFYVLFKNDSFKNRTLIFIQLLGMFMLGTKVSTYGFIILAIISFVIYLFFSLIKKDEAFSKSLTIFLTLVLVASFGLLKFCPMNNRNNVDNNLYSDYNSNGKKESHVAMIKEIEEEIYAKSKKISKGDIIPDGYIKVTDSVLTSDPDSILIIKKEDSDNILLPFIKDNYKDFNINRQFIVLSYPYKYDPYFWFNIMKLPIEERMSFRNIEQMMLQQVKDTNNKKSDDIYGITFSRMGNIFDLERDFLSHYYTLGIAGLIVLLSPYFIIMILCAIMMIKHYKDKFTLKNVMLFLGIGISLCAAYFSGNVMDGLIVTLILGFVYGELLNSIFVKNEDINYKFSIVTPTYNDKDTIIETINSVINQKYTNYEMIIVNDGSTDNTKEIVTNYIKDNKLENIIQYYEEDNQDQLNAVINGSKHITGDYVLILHSDDVLASKNVLLKCNEYLNEFDNLDAIFGNLQIMNEKGKVIGSQKVSEYKKKKYIPALQLLWLGRNLYLDTAVFKTDSFYEYVLNNYLTWNMPFWLNYNKNVEMLDVKKVNFSLIKYRVFSGNYINNEIGKLNVINGELRVLNNLMKYYNIPRYKLQYNIFRTFNKLHLLWLYRPIYNKKETINKSEIIDFVLEKRFGNDYHKYTYLEALHNFYHNKCGRIIKIDLSKLTTYYGKDMRAFDKAMVNKNLDTTYLKLFREMNKGFNKVIVSNDDYDKAVILFKFLSIYNDIEIINIDKKVIPKIIHYVWVGGKEKPKDIKKCMKTWNKHLDGYKVIEWNESNFDINSHPFVKAAYDAKKWAYVSDYIRAWAIYNYGGIYLDTDVLVLDNFDKFLDHEAFVGFENNDHPFTAVFGTIKGHPLVKDMLDYYDNLSKYKFDFKSNNTISVSDLLINKYGCKIGNKEQLLVNDIKVYRDDVLCNPSISSVTIHIFTGTWLDNKKSLIFKIVKNLKLNLNTKIRAELYRKIIK